MTKPARFLKLLGETMDPFRKPDLERYIPEHLRGKSIEERASIEIEQAFRSGIREVKKRHSELEHVEEEFTVPPKSVSK
jgi:hypothetical protein